MDAYVKELPSTRESKMLTPQRHLTRDHIIKGQVLSFVYVPISLFYATDIACTSVLIPLFPILNHPTQRTTPSRRMCSGNKKTGNDWTRHGVLHYTPKAKQTCPGTGIFVDTSPEIRLAWFTAGSRRELQNPNTKPQASCSP